MRVNAQEENSEQPKKDSMSVVLSTTIKLDSIYYPPCILPLEPEPKAHSLFKNLTSVVFDFGCSAQGARNDLKKGDPKLWFSGGIIGCDFSSKADQEFQHKYHLHFVSPGCSRFGNEDPEAYNEVIFEYLDKKYGKGWRDELRIDAIGFKAPRTNIFAQKIIRDLPLPQIANPTDSKDINSSNTEMEISFWWYAIPISGIVLLLLFLYLFKNKMTR
jgi:hypothetical protein